MKPRSPYRLAAAATALYVIMCSATPVLAQTGPELLLRPFRQEDQFELRLSQVVGFSGNTGTADAQNYRLNVIDIDARQRLTYGLDEEGIARAQPRAGFSFTGVDFDTTDERFPERLIDVSAGVGMGILAVDGWIAAISSGVGFAGNAGERTSDAVYFQGDLVIARTFANGTDVLGIVLNYDGNRSVFPDLPLPGFQYRRQLDDTFILSVGFPFSGVEWRPNRRFTLEVNWVIPEDFTARADLWLLDTPIRGRLGVFGSIEGRVDAFFLEELPDNRRLFLRRRLAEVGFLWDVDDRLNLIVAGGYSFGQRLQVGWDTRSTDTVARPSDEPYLRAGFELRL